MTRDHAKANRPYGGLISRRSTGQTEESERNHGPDHPELAPHRYAVRGWFVFAGASCVFRGGLLYLGQKRGRTAGQGEKTMDVAIAACRDYSPMR